MELFHPEVIQIERKLIREMRQHVSSSRTEVCGILGGRQAEDLYQALIVVPVKNALESPTRYRMDPGEQLQAMLTLEQNGYDLVAIYHSHPDGPKIPSETDVAEAYYPEAVQIIWATEGVEWVYAAFIIQSGVVSRVEVQEISP